MVAMKPTLVTTALLAALAAGSPVEKRQGKYGNLQPRGWWGNAWDTVKDWFTGGSDSSSGSVSTAEFNALDYYVQYASAAYCFSTPPSVGSTVTCLEGACADVTSNGATITKNLAGSVTGMYGFVAVDPGKEKVVVSYRGSSNILNWITNIRFLLCDSPISSSAKAHCGFQDAYDELRSDTELAVASALAANPGYGLVVTGHSLGGSVAAIAAGELRANGYTLDAYTYGAARVGNNALANAIGFVYRVTHTVDPVPRLPPMFVGYRHPTTEYWLAEGADTQVDYTKDDIVLCPGTNNDDCNAGTFGLSIDAHLHYLQQLGADACDGDPNTRRDDLATTNLTAIEERLNAWSKMDYDYVKSGKAAEDDAKEG